jgi:hypothetical protein
MRAIEYCSNVEIEGAILRVRGAGPGVGGKGGGLVAGGAHEQTENKRMNKPVTTRFGWWLAPGSRKTRH